MKRTPEPELMNDLEQAKAYLEADFEESHNRFIKLLQEKLPALPQSGRCLDLGCGPGDITRRFARAFPDWITDAVDGSEAMLHLAVRLNADESLEDRIRYSQTLLPASEFPNTDYQLVMSSSLLHHLADPRSLWNSINSAANHDSAIFVMDLFRPETEADAEALVAGHASNEPEVLQRDFYNSLLAAYHPEEVEDQLRIAGLTQLNVAVASELHFIVWGQLGDVA